MRSFSVDLRERVVEARQSGHSRRWIAETFRVNVSTVKRYLARHRRPEVCSRQCSGVLRRGSVLNMNRR
jgi:transposase